MRRATIALGTPKLSEGKAVYEAADGSVKRQVAAMGDKKNASAQQATSEQNRAMDALDWWMGAFVRVAKVALRDEPQLLEKLGILKRNGKTPAQRAYANKADATRAAKKQAAQQRA